MSDYKLSKVEISVYQKVCAIIKLTRLRVEEEGETNDAEEILCWRRFEGFKEVGVLKDCIRGNHMDMGEFQKYLDQHSLGWVFNELFGIDRS